MSNKAVDLFSTYYTYFLKICYCNLHMPDRIRISYKALRSFSPEAARKAVLEYLASNGGNVSETSKIFGINRVVVYDIIKKGKQKNLRDRSKAPRNIPHKTSAQLEDLIVQLKNKLKLPNKDLSFYLFKHHGVDIAYGTLRHILRRNRHRIV